MKKGITVLASVILLTSCANLQRVKEYTISYFGETHVESYGEMKHGSEVWEEGCTMQIENNICYLVWGNVWRGATIESRSEIEYPSNKIHRCSVLIEQADGVKTLHMATFAPTLGAMKLKLYSVDGYYLKEITILQ